MAGRQRAMRYIERYGDREEQARTRDSRMAITEFPRNLCRLIASRIVPRDRGCKWG